MQSVYIYIAYSSQEREWIVGYTARERKILFSFFLRSCKFAGNRGRLVAVANEVVGCINIMQISGTQTLLPLALATTNVLRRTSRAEVDAKCRCLFPPRYARLACRSYRREIARTLHTRHNSTPEPTPEPSILPLAPPSSSLVSLSFYLQFSVLSLFIVLLHRSSIVPYKHAAPLLTRFALLVAALPCDLFHTRDRPLRRRFCAVRSTLERAPSFGTWKRAEGR